MNCEERSPLEQVTSCLNVPDHHDPVEATFAPELRPGFVLDGRFVLDKPISRSGMATIYQAQDTLNDGQTVAVKVPHLRYEADPAFFSRFQREEQIGQKLDHPFILKFLPVRRREEPSIYRDRMPARLHSGSCAERHASVTRRKMP